ncbi:hypothetical protein C7293_14460 [filamentous cyanobacterium CCT1]|nr:hypothetical protein C7293_14460 [filamentous cyanobacterium CCT1]PSN76740.1 hypothetical protein C8B47_25745 [filamentous cyanobacterium CCP4]
MTEGASGGFTATDLVFMGRSRRQDIFLRKGLVEEDDVDLEALFAGRGEGAGTCLTARRHPLLKFINQE